jgi:hypothetical protein
MQATVMPPSPDTATSPLAPLAPATFDVGESVAALVLHFVGDVRDRFALSSVSRVWRRAARVAAETTTNPSSGCFFGAPTTNVRLRIQEGALAAKLTNRRVAKLLECAGPGLHSIEIHGAPAAFTGEGLYSRMLTPEENDVGYFPSRPFSRRLQTVDLSRCVGVRSGHVLRLLTHSQILSRPKTERLHKLGLAGCVVEAEHIPRLDTFVRHARVTSAPFHNFDYWVCAMCDDVIANHGPQCVSCNMTTCADCAGDPICKYCDRFVCDGSDPGAFVTECEICGEQVCDECAFLNAARCSECDDIFCLECKDVFFCKVCEEPLCDDCSVACDACDEVFCKDITHCARDETAVVTCTNCDRSWCDDCCEDLSKAASCSSCDRFFCGDCKDLLRCKKCEEQMCSACAYSCGECHGTFCKDCADDDDFVHTCASCCGQWCKDCKDVSTCTACCTCCEVALCDDCIEQCTGSLVDSDGCLAYFCMSCARGDGEDEPPLLVHCGGCRGTWCQECMSTGDGNNRKCPHCADRRRTSVQNAVVMMGGLSLSTKPR